MTSNFGKKKQYQALAKVLKNAAIALIATASPEAVPATIHTIEVIQRRIARMLADDNPKFFDETKFLENSDPNNPWSDI